MGLYIPDSVADAAISPYSALLFGRLYGLAKQQGYCWASNATLGAAMRSTGRAVQNWLRELEDAGLIRIEQLEGGNRRIYPTATHEPLFTPHEQPFVPPTNSDSPPPRTTVHPPTNGCSPNNDNLTIQDDNYNSNHTSPPATPSERPARKAKQKSEIQLFREAATKQAHQPLVDRYAEFLTGRGHSFDLRSEIERGALRNIKSKLFDIAKGREPEAPPEQIARAMGESWAFILNNWAKLPPFHSNRITLANIYTDLTSIIDFHKNGRNQNQPTNGKPNPYAPIDTERLYNLTRHEAEQFVLHRDNAKRKD